MACYFCGNKETTEKVRVMESPKDTYGILVDSCGSCKEECDINE